MKLENKVIIIGRPNVGKSSLFNILTKSRKALVKNQPGVTRDLQYGQSEWCGKTFNVIDSGGLTFSKDIFSDLIREKVKSFISDDIEAIIFMLDYKSGICAEDREIFKIIKKTGKPFIIALNKIDRAEEFESAKYNYFEFGQSIESLSCERRWGIENLLDWVVKTLPGQEKEVLKTDDRITLSIIGKPNVGKSSLCNFLLAEERMLVSDVAGTTVDTIASEFEFKNKKYRLFDTAGIRRKVKSDLEILMTIKSKESWERSDIVLLIIDGLEGPSDQDAHLVQLILESHKTVILVVNKEDLGRQQISEFRKTIREKISQVFHFFPDIPIYFISAKTGSGIEKMFQGIQAHWEKINVKIKTSELNKFFSNTIRLAPAPVYGVKDVKFYYLTQTKQRPPSFIAFANYPDGVNLSYRRFLSKKIKEKWNLDGIPIRIFAMEHRKKNTLNSKNMM